jgi:hypothetical protein
MKHTIRIKKRGPRNLYFLVDRGAEHQIATSAAFDTICKQESGLAILFEAAPSPESVVVDRNGEATCLGPTARRMRVRFFGRLDDDGIRELPMGAATAAVIVERPACQRGADLSGPLCELKH